MSKRETGQQGPHVGLFVTCLVDLIRPSVGFAAIKLLEDAGAKVEVPRAQTCCGQPAYNAGDRADAKAIARQVIEAFEGFDYVVAPSGSCAGMLKMQYPALLADDPAFAPRAEALAVKTFELTSFLVEVLHVETVAAAFPACATYHDSCSSLREMHIHDAPRRLSRPISANISCSSAASARATSSPPSSTSTKKRSPPIFAGLTRPARSAHARPGAGSRRRGARGLARKIRERRCRHYRRQSARRRDGLIGRRHQ